MERYIRPKVMYAGRYGRWHDIRKEPYKTFDEAQKAIERLMKRINCKTIIHVGSITVEITSTPEADSDMEIIDVKYLEKINNKYYAIDA